MHRFCLALFVAAGLAWSVGSPEADATSFTQLAVTGQPALDADGAVFGEFDLTSYLGGTAVGFRTNLQSGPSGTTVTEANNFANYVQPASPGNALRLVAREGDPVPGLGGPTYGLLFGGPSINAGGEIAFASFVQTGPTGPEVTRDEAWGIFTAQGDTPPSLLIREGDPTPRYIGPEYDQLLGGPSINDAGDLSFLALIRPGDTGPRFDFNEDMILFGPESGNGSPLNALVRENQNAPGVGGPEFFSFSSPALNADGRVAFQAQLRDGPSGQPVSTAGQFAIYLTSPTLGNPELLHLEYDPAPDAGGAAFATFGAPRLNDANELAFTATLQAGDTGPTVDASNNRAIFDPADGTGSPLTMIARQGEAAPGTDGAEYLLFEDLALNNHGGLAFVAHLQTGDAGIPVEFADRIGLFTHLDGNTELLLRTGDDVSLLGPDETLDTRTLADFSLAPRSLSDANELAVVLHFTDDTEALFVLGIAASLLGDFDGDGQIAQSDLNLVLTNWGSPRGVWANATGFGTQTVDQEELNAVLNNWGSVASPSFTASGAVVPEPAAAFGFVMLLLVGGPVRARRMTRTGGR